MCVRVVSVARQSGVLGLAGAALGSGFSVQTWLPYPCVLPNTPSFLYWAQISSVLWLLPLALVCGALSLVMSGFIWRGAFLQVNGHCQCSLFLRVGRCTAAAQAPRHSVWRRAIVSYMILLRGSMMAIGRAIIVELAESGASNTINVFFAAIFTCVLHVHGISVQVVVDCCAPWLTAARCLAAPFSLRYLLRSAAFLSPVCTTPATAMSCVLVTNLARTCPCTRVVVLTPCKFMLRLILHCFPGHGLSGSHCCGCWP